VKHPEDAWIYELIFEMALAGHSEQAIQLELATRSARTRPARRDHRARPFDVGRVSQILDNPAYAGLVVHNGEVAGPGDWPRYVDPEDFYRLRDERRHRSHTTKRRPGRPTASYLLSEMATCGACGATMRVESYRRPRADGTRARRYVCNHHRGMHRDSPEWCPALPFDADEADKLVVSGIDTLLIDAASLREQLNAGRTASIERLGRIVEDARADVMKADRVAAKAHDVWERALEGDDAEGAAIAMDTVRRKRAEVERATIRLNAALDAINAEPAEDEQDVLAQVWHAISGRVADAHGDIRRLNAVLREWFAAFRLSHDANGAARISPILSPAAFEPILRNADRWTPGVTLTIGEDEATMGPCDDDGCGDLHVADPIAFVEAVDAAHQAGEDVLIKVAAPSSLGGDTKPSSTSQNASVLPARATMSNSPQRVR
jgi:hypothetical protein